MIKKHYDVDIWFNYGDRCTLVKFRGLHHDVVVDKITHPKAVKVAYLLTAEPAKPINEGWTVEAVTGGGRWPA